MELVNIVQFGLARTVDYGSFGVKPVVKKSYLMCQTSAAVYPALQILLYKWLVHFFLIVYYGVAVCIFSKNIGLSEKS